MRHNLVAMASVMAAIWPVAAPAAPEEIQVYMDEMSRAREFGLDIHNNYVLSGDRTPDYLGERQSLHQYRITPEFSYGLSDHFELGAYLPLAAIDHRGRFTVDGIKFRLKYIGSQRDTKVFWGANFEIGRVRYALDQNPYNAEAKLIGGVHAGRWTVAANANIDFTVSGPAPGPASLEIASKISYAVTRGFSIGIENYNGVGEFRRLGRFGTSDQSTYLTADTHVGKWDLNVGVGRGYGANKDHWTVKAIVGVPFR
ncbi:MAG: hypothetical protein J0I47_01110 [Sphingomonas sp.]|uniref:hypothetical protein n=1 Tax=Sphingomonas sp. TaxID=28214 RepID=UPI001AC1C1E2|nr:hypothetical protein [Sphingomonas sp.]MBN8806827.1 hypothetical protein [Sphingomonas sp.]